MMPSCSLTAPNNENDDKVMIFPPVTKDGIIEQRLHLRNTSRFPIEYRMYMDSQMPSTIPSLMLNHKPPEVFICNPPLGQLEIGDEIDLVVSFIPPEDGNGEYSDNLVLRLFGDTTIKYGECKLLYDDTIVMIIFR